MLEVVSCGKFWLVFYLFGSERAQYLLDSFGTMFPVNS
jgi:hypothetical protein